MPTINLSLNCTTCNPCNHLGITFLNNVTSYNELGVFVDHHLNFDCRIEQMCAKAKQRAALLLRLFTSRDAVLLSNYSTTYVRIGIKLVPYSLFFSLLESE